jgi:hypothetical protein
VEANEAAWKDITEGPLFQANAGRN